MRYYQVVCNIRAIRSSKRKYNTKFLLMILVISRISFYSKTILLRTMTELFTVQVGVFGPFFGKLLDWRDVYITRTCSYSFSLQFLKSLAYHSTLAAEYNTWSRAVCLLKTFLELISWKYRKLQAQREAAEARAPGATSAYREPKCGAGLLF